VGVDTEFVFDLLITEEGLDLLNGGFTSVIGGEISFN
jgi:hypothetical protein